MEIQEETGEPVWEALGKRQECITEVQASPLKVRMQVDPPPPPRAFGQFS